MGASHGKSTVAPPSFMQSQPPTKQLPRILSSTHSITPADEKGVEDFAAKLFSPETAAADAAWRAQYAPKPSAAVQAGRTAARLAAERKIFGR